MAITTFRIKVGDRWLTVQVGDVSYSPVEVVVDGETYTVDVEGLPPKPPPQQRRARPQSPAAAAETPKRSFTPASSSDKIVYSPMPGRVISVNVHPGDRVSAGDEVCVVEAMKMEQSIRAARDGVVKEVHVKPADSVRADDPLIELE